jgi:hypothetical protein
LVQRRGVGAGEGEKDGQMGKRAFLLHSWEGNKTAEMGAKPMAS